MLSILKRLIDKTKGWQKLLYITHFYTVQMFSTQEVCDILDKSKTTLHNYLKEEPALEPHRSLSNARIFSIEDVYALHHWMIDERKHTFNESELEARIVLYGLSFAVMDQRRRNEILGAIEPIARKYKDLTQILDTYNSHNL